MKWVMALTLVSLLLTACIPAAERAAKAQIVRADVARVASPEVSDQQVVDLVAGANAFAFDLYHAVAKGEEGNLIYSPYSISLAFSMAYAGARGETAAEMAEVLHFLPQEAQHPALNAVDQRLSNLGQGPTEHEEEETPFQLSVANALWGQQGVPFEQPFLETLARQYGAGMRVADFIGAPDAALEMINGWVAQQTNDRIEKILSPGSITPDTRLILANAIYFKAAWLYFFSKSATQDGPFTLLDGRQVTVPLMHQRAGRIAYAEGEGYRAVQLPYRGEAVDMWVILPAEGHFESIEAQLSAGFLDEMRDHAELRDVTLTMPRFDFETELQLRDLLKAMGMPTAFSDAADFGGMAEGGGLYIDQAQHRSTISANEEGTEAAAATMVAMAVEELQTAEMTVDRPFILAIIEREMGTILFLGRLLNPAAG